MAEAGNPEVLLLLSISIAVLVGGLVTWFMSVHEVIESAGVHGEIAAGPCAWQSIHDKSA